MRSLGTRRAGLVAGAATVAVLALAGCSAGQVAETALLDTPIAGVDSQTADGSVFVRNLQVEYPGPTGYEAGENAPLELSLYNQTNDTITVTVSSRPLERGQVISATQVGTVAAAPVRPSAAPSELPSGGAPSQEPSNAVSGEPSAASSASAPAAPRAQVTPARIEIGPQGSALFRPSDTAPMQLIGLSDELLPGMSVNLVFEFSNNAQTLELQAPVAIPLEAASRAPAEGEAEGEAEGH